jgi:hypothetical protein
MIRKAMVRSVVAVSLLCTLSCGAKTESEGPVSAEDLQTKEEFLEAMAEAYCQIAECYPFAIRNVDGECAENYVNLLRSTAEWNLPGFRYDPERAAECISLVTGISCEDLLSGDVDDSDACDKALTGGKASGETCSFEECQDGLYCDDSASCPGICRPRPSQGEACTSRCAQGHVCIGETSSAPGRCEAYGSEGMECGLDVRACGGGLGCDESVSPAICRPYFDVFPFAAQGEACDKTTQCDRNSYCNVSVDAPVCAPRIGLGESCSAIDCQIGLYCDPTENLCMAPIAQGQPCTALTSCVGGMCIDGTCQPQRPIGEPCTESASCGTYHCADGVCALNPICDP